MPTASIDVIFLVSISGNSSLWSASVALQPGLCLYSHKYNNNAVMKKHTIFGFNKFKVENNTYIGE